MAEESTKLPPKVVVQIVKMRLPLAGAFPFRPRLVPNKAGEPVISRELVRVGPRKGALGVVDQADRIWIRDTAHAGVPDHGMSK